MKPVHALVLLALAALTGCGDPRMGFVGSYPNSTTIMNMTVDGKATPATTSTGATNLAIDTNDADQIRLDDSCGLVGVVTSPNAFTVRPVTCPPATSGDCQVTLTVKQGTGTLTGKNLAVTLSGDGVGTCSNGTGQHPISFVMTLTGAKSDN